MADTGLAELLENAPKKKFSAESFYEPATDSLIYYDRDERSYGKRISKHFTVFLSVADHTPVGYEIKGFQTICDVIENLGTVQVAGPTSVINGDGEECELALYMRAAIVQQEDRVNGELHDQLNEVSEGVTINRRKFCPA